MPGKRWSRKRRTSFAGDEGGSAFLEALLVILVSALALVWVRGALVEGATGLVGRTAETSWSREWVMFDAAARRHAEEVELPYWNAYPRSALAVTEDGLEVAYDAGGVERRFALAVSGRRPAAPPATSRRPPATVELRVDGQLVEALPRVAAADIEPWIGADRALLGIVLRLEGPDGVDERTHLRFGTPGGTL